METHEFIESKNLVQEFYTISKIRLKVNEPVRACVTMNHFSMAGADQ